MEKEEKIALGMCAAGTAVGLGMMAFLCCKKKKDRSVIPIVAGETALAGTAALAAVAYGKKKGKESLQGYGRYRPVAMRGDTRVFSDILRGSSRAGDRLFGTVWAANEGDENAQKSLEAQMRELGYRIEKLSGEMRRAFGKGVRFARQYTSKYGCYVALACYASGHVELGVLVDGIIILFDVTDAVLEYSQTGDLEQYLLKCSSILLSMTEGWLVGNSIDKMTISLPPESYSRAVEVIKVAQGNVFAALTNLVIANKK